MTNGIRRNCWCGNTALAPFSTDYRVCAQCGTLVSQVGLDFEQLCVRDDDHDFYGKQYWLSHQVQDLGNPDIFQRARQDMPERCLHWLKMLMAYRLPPAKVLEIGCAHGGFVALLRWAGYDAMGLELSPWIVDFARNTFDIPILLGPIEKQELPIGSLDLIVLNDVLEHLPDPLGTLSACIRLLQPERRPHYSDPQIPRANDVRGNGHTATSLPGAHSEQGQSAPLSLQRASGTAAHVQHRLQEPAL